MPSTWKNGMMEYWNDELKKMTILDLIPLKRNFTITQFPIFQNPIFQLWTKWTNLILSVLVPWWQIFFGSDPSALFCLAGRRVWLVMRPLKNVHFCLSLRKAIISTTGIHWVFRGLKFKPDAEIEQKGAFCKGLWGKKGWINVTGRPLWKKHSHKHLYFFKWL